MDSYLKEWEKIALKQQETEVKAMECFDGIVSKFANYDVTTNSNAKFISLCKGMKDHCSDLSEALKSQYSLVGKFIKTVDKKFTMELGANDEKINLDAGLLDLAIVNHFFREGQFDIGETFAKEAAIAVPDELKNQFLEMFQILEAVKTRDLVPAIKWCEKNRETLMKRGSELEFSLHRLQFLHLLCNRTRQEALQYAKSYFQPFAETNIKDIQRLMASMIYAPKLMKSPYADLLAQRHWSFIQISFTREFCSILGFPSDSPLYTSLVVGTAALPKLIKLNSIMKEKKAEWSQQDELPIEIELGNDQRYHSIFACPVLKQVSTEDNPPMIMPCGHVICKEALVRLSKGNSSRFKCPYCPSESIPSQAQRVYF